MSITDSLFGSAIVAANDNGRACIVCAAVYVPIRKPGRVPHRCPDCVASGKKAEPVAPPPGACPCGVELPPKMGRGRRRAFCSDACKATAYGDKYRKPATKVPHADRQCLECDIAFVPAHGRQRYCTARCQHDGEKRRAGERGDWARQRNAKNAQAAPKPCLHCGAEFRRAARSRDAALFCSRECFAADSQVLAEARKAFRRVRVVSYRKDCKLCGKRFGGGKTAVFCSYECRHPKIPRESKPCVDCGSDIVGTKGKLRCKPCNVKRSRRMHVAKHGRTKTHKDRARRFGVKYEAINPLDVFARDKWTCQMCFTKTPKRLRGSNDNRAPELDHIVPMAMGGDHVWSNVQCSCRQCNGAKGGDKVIGQLRLAV